MSVLVPDLEVYEAVFNKAWAYGFRKQVDINYCSCLSFDVEETVRQHVKNWLYLNELSYQRRYREEDGPRLVDFLTFRTSLSIDSYQMLKFLQCIQYNIELSTIRTGYNGMQEKIEISAKLMESYELLSNAISEISQRIIEQLPKYKEAEWSSIKTFCLD